MPQDVLTAFLTRTGEARGRPVGLTLDKYGALLMADDVGNKIWKVAPNGTPQQEQQSSAPSNSDQSVR